MIERLLRQALGIVKQFISILWRGTPWALGLLFYVMFFAFRIATLSVLSWFGAVPEASRRLADVWAMRARKAGFPSIWHRELRGAFLVLAFLSFYLGWAFTLFSVVFAFSWLLFRISF